MTKITEIVRNSLEYLDNNKSKYKSYLNKIEYYSLEFLYGDLERHKIIFYDKNKNKLFETEYEIIGVYNNFAKTWAWSWSIANFSKNEVYLARKILMYGLDIVPDKDTIFLKSELITSRFRISNPIQLDIHVGLASYLSKIPFIFKLYIPTNLNENLEGNLYPILTDDDFSFFDNTNFQIYYLFLLNEKIIL